MSFTIVKTGVDAILSKTQIRALSLVSEMTGDEMAVVAATGKGATKTLAIAHSAMLGFDKVCTGFVKDGCRNVSGFARIIRAITGQLADTNSLKTCPTNYTGFYAYEGDLIAWSNGTYDKKEPSEKTLTTRAKTARQCIALIRHVQTMRNEFEAQALADSEAQALADSGAQALAA